MGTTTQQKPHVVCMPFPAQGHIHAMLKLAKLLHSKGFHITFVHTEFNYNRILTSSGPSSLEGLEDFRFEAIPDGLPPPSDAATAREITSLCLAIKNNMADTLCKLLKRLNEPTSGVPPVTCIVSDNVTSFTLEVAAEFGIPDVFFCSASACGFMGSIQYKELEGRGLVPLKSEDDLTNGYLDTPIDWVPGMKNMRLKDFPSFLRTTDPNDVLFNYLKDECQAAKQASAIIVHTFDDLENDVLGAMSVVLPPIYPIGPLNLLYHKIPDGPLKAIGSNSLWEEDTSCLKWLEEKNSGSVIYANFGSLAVVTNAQLIEFAWGLSDSGYDFLWVLRPDSVMGGSAALPEELLEETRGRGLMTTWCPQEQVLMHPAIGGFLTHCGWNSMMESISAGVPILCWPYLGDQQTNCRYACTEWGIGMEIDNEVKRGEVEGLIRELMDGEKGKEMKRRARHWREASLKATEPGGKSSINLDRVVEEVLLGGRL